MHTSEPEASKVWKPLSARPALPTAILFMVGVLLHRPLPHVPGAWLGLCLFAVVLAIFARKRAVLCSILIGIGLISIGCTAAQLYAFQYPENEITRFAGDDPRLAELELEIVTPPRVLTDPFNPNRAMPPKQVATARVWKVKTWSGWTDASGDLLLQITQPHPRLQLHQKLTALGMLQRPAPAMNPGQFDWASYYRDQRVLTSFQIHEIENIKLLNDGHLDTVGWLREQARRLLGAGFPADRSLDHALLRALLLGDSDPQLHDVQEQFQRTGTSHHLAISGMHVAVLGTFVFFVCRALCFPPRTTAIVATLFVFLYGMVALPSPPVLRSIILFISLGLGLASRRSLDLLNLLAASALAMLIVQPLDLYNAGFHLSFGTVLGMILLTPHMTRAIRRVRDDPDVEVAKSFAKPTLWSITADHANGILINTVSAGIVAWLVSMPLIAWHFERLNPWAVPASIILGVVVFIALIAGFFKILLTLLWPSFAPTWASIATWPVEWMRQLVDWLATWPRSDVPLPPPHWLLITLYYGCLLTMMIPFKRSAAVWFWRINRTAVLLLILWIPYESNIAGNGPGPNNLRVTLLAVGAGQCAIVEPPSGRVVLIDAGSLSLNDLVSKCLGPCLRHRGCTNVDSIFLSHADFDHISAAAEVAESYQVREVLTGLHFTDHAMESAPAVRMLKRFDELQRPPRIVEPGQKIPLGRDTAIEILWPPRETGKAVDNDVSLVLRVTHAGRSILFPGDIEDVAMKALLKNQPDALKSDVLVAAHHGSSEGATRAFVNAVDPVAIVSSNDRTLSQRQVDFESMIGNRPLMRTHRAGAITIEIDSKGTVRVMPFLNPAYPALEFPRINASTP